MFYWFSVTGSSTLGGWSKNRRVYNWEKKETRLFQVLPGLWSIYLHQWSDVQSFRLKTVLCQRNGPPFIRTHLEPVPASYFLRYDSSKCLLSKRQPLSHVRRINIWSKWMLGRAPDLWSLVALLKLTWFHLGAQPPIWSDLETCTLFPLHFKSCWGPSALKPERDFRGGSEAVSWIPNLITHLLKWCPPAAQTAQAATAPKLRSLLEHFYARNKPTVPTFWTARTSRESGFAVCSFN